MSESCSTLFLVNLLFMINFFQSTGSHVLVWQVKQINKNIKARSKCRQFDVKNITLFIVFFLVNERLSLISLDEECHSGW